MVVWWCGGVAAGCGGVAAGCRVQGVARNMIPHCQRCRVQGAGVQGAGVRVWWWCSDQGAGVVVVQ